MHPYAGTTFASSVPPDVALLTVSPAFDLTGTAVKAIALVPPGQGVKAGDAVTLDGWGLHSDASPSTSVEYSGAFTIKRQFACGVAGEATVLCGTSPTAQFCDGDSGAGVVRMSTPPVLVAVGRTSDGRCDDRDDDDGFMDLAQPEVASWLRGDDDPARGPDAIARALMTQDPHVGQTLDCADDGPSEWTNAPRSYGYLWADATTSVVLATGQQYTPTAADAGRSIECAGIATNAGATTEGYPSEPHTVGAAVPVSSSTTAVAPPPAADTTPPPADDGQAVVRHSRSLLTRLSRRRQGRRFLVTLHVGAALVGHRASVAWETDKRKHGPSVHETRQTVTLQASTVLRSPVVPRGRFLELILTPPGVTVAGVAYDDVDLRVQVGRR